MPSFSKFLRAILILSTVGALVALAVWFPPDGRERAGIAQFFGRFHPLVIHLPIGLLILVPLLEIAGRADRQPHLRFAAGFVLWVAAIGAILAAADGWLLAYSGGYQGTLVQRHLWGGTALALVSLAAASLRSRLVSETAGPSRHAYFALLAAAVLLMGWTSHQGGSITHGEKYLTEHLPSGLRAWVGGPSEGRGPPRQATEGSPTFYDARVVPILEEHCASCHRQAKHKGGLRVDGYAELMRGGESGLVIKPGDFKGSELYRRVTLPSTDDDFMPADGKPALSADEIKILELWIAAGASATQPIDAIAGAPAPPAPVDPVKPLAPDYRPRLVQAEELANALGVRLVPRSRVSTDGLVLRTASAPGRCDDAALARLAPVADLIVEAELARTRITDAGLRAVATWRNLTHLDLARTAVTSVGVEQLAVLPKLASLNLSGSKVDAPGVAHARTWPALKTVWAFGSPAEPDGAPTTPAQLEAGARH